MAKVSTQYVCSNCGAKAPQMIGRCPVCGEWGTYEEEVSTAVAATKGGAGLRRGAKAQRLHEVDAKGRDCPPAGPCAAGQSAGRREGYAGGGGPACQIIGHRTEQENEPL